MRHFCAISSLSSLDHARTQGQRIFLFGTNELPCFRRSRRVEVALTCEVPSSSAAQVADAISEGLRRRVRAEFDAGATLPGPYDSAQ